MLLSHSFGVIDSMIPFLMTCDYQPPHLLELLLFGVVVVPVNDNHAIDHIVVQFKAVAEFNITPGLK